MSTASKAKKSYRGVAQFGRALRSGRRGRVFESRRLDYTSVWPVGQAVKTTPSHGVNPGSIPGQVIESCFGFSRAFFKLKCFLGSVGRATHS